MIAPWKLDSEIKNKMIAQNTIIYATNIALVFGIFITLFVLIIVRIGQIFPKKYRQQNGFSTKTFAIFGILFFLTSIIAGMVFAGNINTTNSAVAQDNQKIQELENQLEDSINRINFLMSESQADKEELRELKYELEDALKKVRERKTKTRVILVPTPHY